MDGNISLEETDDPPGARLAISNQPGSPLNVAPRLSKSILTKTAKSFYADLSISQASTILLDDKWKRGKLAAIDAGQGEFIVSARTRQFRQHFYPNVTDDQWND
jgi:hypothetical protein